MPNEQLRTAMIAAAGYELVETLHAGTRVTTQRVRELATGGTRLIRTTSHFDRTTDTAALAEAAELLAVIGCAATSVDLSTGGRKTREALFTPDIGGQVVVRQIPGRGMPLPQVLTVALGLATIVQKLHAARVIHKCISAPSILFDPDSGDVDLLCYCVASRIPRETRQLVHPERMEGDLAYVSPEQTGRMNRVIDYRSDYYSLGATMYHMLTDRKSVV